jgi:hypothetical protein
MDNTNILILPSHLRLGLSSGLFPSGFPTNTLHTPIPSPSALHTPPIPFFPILSPAQYWVRKLTTKDIKFLICSTYRHESEMQQCTINKQRMLELSWRIKKRKETASTNTRRTNVEKQKTA